MAKRKVKKAKVKAPSAKKTGRSNLTVPSPSGVPGWLWIVILALVVLVLLLFLQPGVLTGAYHQKGNTSDFVKLTDLSFTPVNSMFITASGYRGNVAAVRIRSVESPFRGLTFKFNNRLVTSVYVITKKLSNTSLPVGSVVYYDGDWQTASVGVSNPNYMRGMHDFRDALVPLYTISTARSPFTNIIVSFTSSASDNPADFVATLSDYVPVGDVASPSIRGIWQVAWDNSDQIELQGVTYKEGLGAVRPVSPVFESPSESVLRAASNKYVIIRYAYDARLSGGLQQEENRVLRMANITIVPETISLTDVNGSQFRVGVFRVQISSNDDAAQLTFKFGRSVTRNIYFVARPFTDEYPYVRNYSGGISRLTPGTILYFQPTYRDLNIAPYRNFDCPSRLCELDEVGFSTWLYSLNHSNVSRVNTLTIRQSPSYPSFYPSYPQLTFRDNGNDNFSPNTWNFTWNLTNPRVGYPFANLMPPVYSNGVVLRYPSVGFATPAGATFLFDGRNSTQGVKLQYAYFTLE